MKREKANSRERLLDITFEEVYRYGYQGASTAAILKKAGVPKGSMYHHFGSKKEMVIAMIEERLIPKVRLFFDFRMKKGVPAMEVVTRSIEKISDNEMLIRHGCPLHRLMFEMELLDEEIAARCEAEFEHLTYNLSRVLAYGMREGSVAQADPDALAAFLIASTWGLLSRPAAMATKAHFLQDAAFLLRSIQP